MGIVADNRRSYLAAETEKKCYIRLTTCKCGNRLTDHLEMLNDKCFPCMLKKWEGIAEDALL